MGAKNHAVATRRLLGQAPGKFAVILSLIIKAVAFQDLDGPANFCG